MASYNRKNRALAASAIIHKTRLEVPTNNPHADFLYSIFESAMRDLVINDDFERYSLYKSAASYLRSDMVHLELIGISADWVKRLIRQVGFTEV